MQTWRASQWHARSPRSLLCCLSVSEDPMIACNADEALLLRSIIWRQGAVSPLRSNVRLFATTIMR